MNTSAERVPSYRWASTGQGLYGTTGVYDGYQDNLVLQAAAEDYKIQPDPPATAKGLLTRRDSTFVTSNASVSRPEVRVAEWDGYVIEVGETFFTAALRGIAGEGVVGEDHGAEIALNDVGRSDRALLRPGAFFRICIYFELDQDDRPKRYAKVVFRRLPAYRQADLELADKRSEERHRKLRVE